VFARLNDETDFCIFPFPRVQSTRMKVQADNSNRFVIIMAGGRGGRFWPVNRQRRYSDWKMRSKKFTRVVDLTRSVWRLRF
jgi:hypothetical protein